MKWPPTWTRGSSEGADEDPRPEYARTTDEHEPQLVVLMARGDLPRVIQAAIELVQNWVGPVGVAGMDAVGDQREWAASGLTRHGVLAALMSHRDLLGAGVFDFAVFSEGQMEVYLDRFGTLEVRTGDWDEPRALGVLETRGFVRVPRVSALPGHAPPSTASVAELALRLHAFKAQLGVEGPAQNPPAEDVS